MTMVEIVSAVGLIGGIVVCFKLMRPKGNPARDMLDREEELPEDNDVFAWMILANEYEADHVYAFMALQGNWRGLPKAFTWHKTPQGFKYWWRVFNHMRRGGDLSAYQERFLMNVMKGSSRYRNRKVVSKCQT